MEKQSLIERLNKIYARIGDRAFNLIKEFRGNYLEIPTQTLGNLSSSLEHLERKTAHIDTIFPRQISYCPDAYKADQIIQNNLTKINQEIRNRLNREW